MSASAMQRGHKKKEKDRRKTTGHRAAIINGLETF